MFEAAFEPPSETPCDPVPAAESGWAGRRTRIAATLGVGLVGAASLSTAVYQTISQSSTTVVMPGAVQELDTPLPWGAPVAAPAGAVTSSPTITPTVAALALRSEQQPLAQPAVPAVPALGVSAPRPAAGPVDAGPRPSPVVRGGGGGRPSATSGSNGVPSTSTGTGSSSPSSPPASSEPPAEPTSEPTTEPSGEPTTQPSTQAPSETPSSNPPASSGTPSGTTTSPSGDGAG